MKKHLPLSILFTALCFSLQAQSILGLDVSHYEGTITWSQVKNPGGKIFAWAKATEGLTYTDPNYVTNATNGTAAGVVMGAYHFAHPETNTAAAEAAYFVSIAGPYIGVGNLPPALDLEDPSGGTPLLTYYSGNSAGLTAWVQAWMTAVQNATGVKPVLYTSASVAAFLGSSLNTYGLWIADPDGSATAQPANIGVWTTWAFKQYSWTGTVSGISGTGNNDLDVFNGTTTAFNTLIGTVTAVTPSFTASATTVCVGSTITFTDHSTSTGTITGHSWTFGDGTPGTSTATNPTVTYNTAGTYDVNEVVTSSTGRDSVTQTGYIHVIPTATLPLVQTFQSSTFPPTGWTMNFPSPVDSPWALCTYNGYNSSQCMYFPANCGYTHSTAGQRQQLYTPDYSFASATNPKMWFEVAYEPYNNTYSDTLAIYYSTDCGTTWNNIYLKGGMTLCSTGFNVASGTDTSGGRGCFAPPNAQAWRADTISLTSLAGNSSVMFSFESRSGWGNILYLDNINVASTTICTPPATPTVQASPALTNCGPVQLTASSSGCTGCTYNWSNNATGSTITASATGTYSVTATNSGCASSATSVAVTVNAPPTVAASPSAQQVCAGQQVMLTATGNGTSFQWSGIGLQTNTGASVNAIVSTAGSQAYTVTATLNGCTATANTSVTFNATVTPTINITQTTTGTICTGAQVSFSSTITNGGTSPVYHWTSGNQTGTGSTFTLNNATNGATVKCELISNANCASPDTVTSTTLTVTTQPVVQPTISISQTTANPVCTGAQVVFSSSVTNAGNSPVYQWIASSNQTGTGSAFTLNNAANGTTVRCLLISSANCASPDSVYSNTITVATQAVQPVSISISTPDTNVCSGENIAFTSSANNGGTNPAYNWFVNGTSMGSGSGYTINNITSGSSVYCVFTSSASCVTGSPATSNTLNIHIQNSVQASVTITASADTICANQPVTFTATPGNGGNNPTYTWAANASIQQTGNSPVFIDSALTSGSAIICVMVSSSSCVTNPSVRSNAITVQINPAPLADAGNTHTVLQGDTVILGGSPPAMGGTPPYTYLWSPSTGLNSATTANPTDAHVAASTVYTLVVTDTRGCTASSVVDVNVTNCALATPVVQVNFCDLATPQLTGVNYQWLLQGQPITGATTRFYSATSSGYYNVKITDNAGCSAQSADTYMSYPACLTTGIETVTDEPAFDIYPNPASVDLEVSFSNTLPGTALIEIFDVCGQQVYTTSGINIVTGNKYMLDIHTLAAGPYLLRLTNSASKNRFAVKRFIKM